MCIVSDQSSEAGNLKKTFSNYKSEVVSDVSYDFKKILESCPKEFHDGLPIPVIMSILVRVEFLAPSNSSP
jgi:hypothetical protein